MNQPDAANIVVGTDGSATASRAVERAVEVARQRGATLHLVSAYNPKIDRDRARALDAVPEDVRWKLSPGEQAERVVHSAAEVARAEGVAFRCHTAPGEPAKVLIDVASAVEAELMVVGNKGMRGRGSTIIPSVPKRVAHRAPCDVLIVDTTAA